MRIQKMIRTTPRCTLSTIRTTRSDQWTRLMVAAVAQHGRMPRMPGWDLHPLKGNLEGHWSISVNGNWRMTFKFAGTDAELVGYQDYH